MWEFRVPIGVILFYTAIFRFSFWVSHFYKRGNPEQVV